MGFLSDPKYLSYKGFETVDTANPYFELLYLPFDRNALKPCFKSSVKGTKQSDNQNGFAVYYTSQCPFTAKYVPILADVAKKNNVSFKAVPIVTRELAQNALIPFTTFSLFYNDEFLTHEIISEKKFEKIILEKGL